MSATAQKDWKKDFGLEGRKPPHFFSSVDQLDDVAGQVPAPHALRRAFDQLGIEGVLCQEHSPVIYFLEVRKIDRADIINIHRSFWNQGIAPILVIIAPDEVHVYSGLIPPENSLPETGQAPGWVETLNRVQDQLRAFLLSVESGEYFHIHRHSFDPHKRVDRNLLRNLKATRQDLGEVQAARVDPQTLDAFLCRLVFTCYLFDRGIIDSEYLKALHIHDAGDLKDVLAKKPRTDAKADLYKLFGQLGNDFNGDLFSADLEVESRQIRVEHLDILNDFFHGTDVRSGQQAFWPYNFGFIPIETISAIYEHFLKAAGEEQKKEAGAFYTPRFLAEFVLDVVLENETTLLDKRFLDPACGSGIFLVGLFNRLAEQWKLMNPGARYDRRANGLMDILCNNLYGVDSNPSACQITAFSLYLAFLDQLSPPDIRKLLGKWNRLPYLVFDPDQISTHQSIGTIRRADFFTEAGNFPHKVHVIVGNPPWGPVKNTIPTTAAETWCAERKFKHPNREKSTPFIWKAPTHLEDGGKACFILPHGLLFNHNDTSISFQQSLFRTHAVDRVVNMTDFQFFLFEESRAPALIIQYRKEKPTDSAHLIDYWAPKTDWAITQAEIVSIAPQDRSRFSVREVLDDLNGDDAPLIWKERFWATSRDSRLLDRLRLYPRLRDVLGQRQGEKKRWIVAEGFEPFGGKDLPQSRRQITLSKTARVEACSHDLELFFLPNDCDIQKRLMLDLRRGISDASIFKKPLVLVTEGFSKVAYANFNIAYRHGIRGIHGPPHDAGQLAFLAAYLRSSVARYFLFHTSASWGVSRARVDVDDLMRLPFPFPKQTSTPRRAREIVDEVRQIMTDAARQAGSVTLGRKEIVLHAQAKAEVLIEEYFDIDETERMLIADTDRIIIPSVRPSRNKRKIPETIAHSSLKFRDSYVKLLCKRLNGWAKQKYMVHAEIVVDSSIGVGLVVLEKNRREEKPSQLAMTNGTLLKALENLQRIAVRNHGTFALVRGLKVFHKDLLYITKPLGQRFWTNTAALNDADEIAATILTRSGREGA